MHAPRTWPAANEVKRTEADDVSDGGRRISCSKSNDWISLNEAIISASVKRLSSEPAVLRARARGGSQLWLGRRALKRGS